MVGVSTKRRVFQYLNNLSRPDQQDKMMAVNVPANNWDVHIRTCRRPRTMLTFLVELQRRSQWPQFKTAVQTFCLFAFMCWQSYQKIFHASALLSQGENFGTWGDGLISFDAETWRIKVNVRLKSLYCFLCSSLSLKCWKKLSAWCLNVLSDEMQNNYFWRPCCSHIPPWCAWTHRSQKNDFATQKESILMHYDNICKRDTAGYFKEAFGRF